ncbi:MAG: hypothetical protein ACLUOI_27220 [Eisenbergiella sp.]
MTANRRDSGTTNAGWGVTPPANYATQSWILTAALKNVAEVMEEGW